jgi:hypothetical protein
VPVADIAEEIKQQLGVTWIPNIYDRILRLRTRAYHLGKVADSTRVEVQHTLLGIELKVGRRRLFCPDLATARYLSVFARTGCSDVVIPYDITKISRLADELESSWYRMLLLTDNAAREKTERFRTRLRRTLFARIRTEVAAAGGGNARAGFREDDKQRGGKF